MSDYNNSQNRIKELIKSAKNIAIIPNKVAGVDAFSAGVGLYKMLKDEGKNVSFIYPGSVPEEAKQLIGDSEITKDIGVRKLMVSIDYSESNASKVYYYTENDTLYFTISPVKKDFDLSKIKSQIKGYDFDLVISIGAQVLEDFGSVSQELKESYNNTNIINIDNTEMNRRFGNINVIDNTKNSLSLLLLNIAPFWGLNIGSSAAKAFLTGISHRSID